MNIILSGGTGFIGKYIRAESLKRGHTVTEIDLRKIFSQNNPRLAVACILGAVPNESVFIHAAAVKNPKSELDEYFNTDVPSLLQQEYLEVAKSGTFVFISSLNVRIRQLNDFYTKQKQNAEKKLTDKNTIILRPGLVWSSHSEGERLLLERYLRLPLPFHPVPYPGNYYSPIYVCDLASYIVDTVMEPIRHKEINIFGDKKVSFFELAQSVSTNRRLVKLPHYFFTWAMRSPHLFRKYSFLNQLISIDRTVIEKNVADHSVTLPFQKFNNLRC